MGQIEELIEAHEESIHLLTLMNLEVQPWAEETNWEFEKVSTWTAYE